MLTSASNRRFSYSSDTAVYANCAPLPYIEGLIELRDWFHVNGVFIKIAMVLDRSSTSSCLCFYACMHSPMRLATYVSFECMYVSFTCMYLRVHLIKSKDQLQYSFLNYFSILAQSLLMPSNAGRQSLIFVERCIVWILIL